MWIVSWLKKKFMYCVYMYVFCHFKKINEKKPWENIFFYRWLYFIPNIKLKIMLYEPFMLNMVWKSTERFGKLSL